ncbi:cytochrome b5-like heme/steroid binding domain-containing protein [Aspergillus clavatus NRRL 1]|uniref:Cytochrome b5-like heme/steroid binding domain protein n=1 Tax=Aspergillus clavatus (strain ATCC 1007 / CBS 513.65 / DSM 816 / NCTC 3887 / NRRL 1 / QM 1276 / 107) TaxID=344612 RepID=A1CGN3_ASPCL|nr:cytochrome b5-like heme/steroid binding domain protein [Aspergillus clavatus NRRL 1]EAW11113.1 cytochrome b5-like heme/steroid binding domain protein [Aspergillus clavatus NRRL 1]
MHDLRLSGEPTYFFFSVVTMINSQTPGVAPLNDGTTDYVPLRKHSIGTSHISDQPMAWTNWPKAYWTPLHPLTALLAVVYHFNAGLGITAGHSSITDLPCCGWGCSGTGFDSLVGSRSLSPPPLYRHGERPNFSAQRVLIFTYWPASYQAELQKVEMTDVADPDANPVVVWQHKNFIKSALFMTLIFPTLACGLGWGDLRGGLIYSGILRVFFIQQATFYWGQYDPTKWAIWIWKKLGVAYDLKQFRKNEISKGRLQQLQKKIGGSRWSSPVLDWDGFVTESASRALVAIGGVIPDVFNFIQEDPGGKAFISSVIGKDGTGMFNGAIYQHSNAAHNLLLMRRVGVLRGGCEVEIWKYAMAEAKHRQVMPETR